MSTTRAFALVALCTSLAVACGGKANGDRAIDPATAPDGGSSTSAVDPAAINLGLVASLSGPDRVVGESIQKGAELAVEQLSALGGIAGRKVVLHVEDDRSEADQTRAKMEALEARGVRLGIGPTTSTQALAAIDLVRGGRVLYVSPTATSSALDLPPETRPTSFTSTVLYRTLASDRSLAIALAQYTSESVDRQRRCPKIVLVSEQGAEFETVTEWIANRYLQLSLRVVKTPAVRGDAPHAHFDDLAQLVAREAFDTPVCQVLVLGTRSLGMYARAYGNLVAMSSSFDEKKVTTIAGGVGVLSPTLLTDARYDPSDPYAPSAVEGWDIVTPAEHVGPEHSAFLTAWTAKYPGTVPDIVAAASYDATLLLAAAAARAGEGADLATTATNLGALSIGRSRTGPDDLASFTRKVSEGDDLNYEGASGGLDLNPATGATPNDFTVTRLGTYGTRTVEERFEASMLSYE